MERKKNTKEILIQFIGIENASDINIKNEPFKLFGRMLPCYQNGKWSYSILENEKVGQDNNLAACLCYINNGFRIGGVDTDVYIGTGLEGNVDIYFYKDAE